MLLSNVELFANMDYMKKRGGYIVVKYNPLTPELVQELESIVGVKNVTVDAEKMEKYSHDEETDVRYHCLLYTSDAADE